MKLNLNHGPVYDLWTETVKDCARELGEGTSVEQIGLQLQILQARILAIIADELILSNISAEKSQGLDV